MEALRTIAIATPIDHGDNRTGPLKPAVEDGVQIHQLLGVLRRRLAAILLLAIIGAGLAAMGATMLQKFAAKALILVEPRQGASGASAGNTLSSDEQTVIETHIMILTAGEHLNAVVRSLAGAGEVDPGRVTLRDLERGLKVQQELHSRVISLTFTSKDAGQAALVANRVADLYVAQLRDQKRAGLRRQRTDLEAKIADLRGQLGQAEARAPADADAVAELRRRIEETRILQSAVDRQGDIAERQQGSDSGVSLLSPALRPDRPSTGNPLLLAMPAGIAFAILGVFLALLVEGSDRSLRSERDIEAVLGVPCLGMVPTVRRPTDPRAFCKRWLRHPPSAYGEALRTILFELVIAPATAPKVVLVGSALRREGRSALAFGLAAGAAKLGRRTVLLDLDWRDACGHRRDTTPGALDMLAGGHLETVTVALGSEAGFDQIGVGAAAADPAALMATGRLADLIGRLAAAYDLVIIDGPSLLAVAEASMLAGLADKVLLTVRWGRTRRDLARRALVRLRQATTAGSRPSANRVGVVITAVNLRRHALYGFGDTGEALGRM